MSELALSNGHADPDIKRIVGDFGPRELVSVSKAASPQTRYALAGGVPIGDELGRSGLRHWGGFVFEEWLRELQQGRRAAEVFRDMMDSDAIVGAIMYAIEMLVRRVSWWWEPADSSRDAKQAAEWCDGLLKDMRFSWPDTLSEIFSFLGYGYAYEEIVYKKRQGDSRDRLLRSKFDDNTIGVAKLALRSQDSLWKWVFDENDEIEGMIQNPPPDYLLRFIPLEKALHFRTKIFKNNPEGRSVLRSAYGAWYFAKNMRAIEGIGVERDLAGLPMLTPPEGVDIWNLNDPAFAGERAAAQALVSSVRRDEQEGIIKPYGWEFELVSTAGARQFDVGKIITRYETRIATSVLADLVMLGQDKVGSYALAVTKKDLFASSLGAYLDIVAAQFNDELVEKVWSLNGFRWPKPTLKHGAVETVDLDTLGNYIMRLGQSGAPIDWESVLPWASVQAGMPEPKPGHDFTPRNLIRPGSDAPPKDRLTAVVKADEDDGD